MELEIEKMSEEFTKYILHFHEQGFHPALHLFTGADKGDPHDHPWNFKTTLLKGSYIERVYTVYENGEWHYDDYYRREGYTFYCKATQIHQLIDFPDGYCITWCIAEAPFRHPNFWDFSSEKAISRPC